MNRSGSKLVSLLEWSNSWTLDLVFACCKRKIIIRKLEGSTSGCLVPDVEVASHIFFSVPQMPSSSTEERRVWRNLCRYLKTLFLIVETLLVSLQKGNKCRCIASSGMWKSRKKKIPSFFTGRDEAPYYCPSLHCFSCSPQMRRRMGERINGTHQAAKEERECFSRKREQKEGWVVSHQPNMGNMSDWWWWPENRRKNQREEEEEEEDGEEE